MRGDALMIIDGSGVITEWSHEAASLLGLPASEVLGLPATGLFTVAKGNHGGEALQLSSREGRTSTCELWVRPVLQDGAVAWEIGRQPSEHPGGTHADGISESLIEALFTESPIGLHILDRELRIVRINNAATRVLHGVPPEGLLGRPLAEVYPSRILRPRNPWPAASWNEECRRSTAWCAFALLPITAGNECSPYPPTGFRTPEGQSSDSRYPRSR